MQEVKTLFHRVDSEQACAASDAIINALLADGWTIQATTIAAAVGSAEYSTEAYLSVMLIRETEPDAKPEFDYNDKVTVTEIVVSDDEPFFEKVGAVIDVQPDGENSFVYDVEFENGIAKMYQRQLSRVEIIPF